MGGLFIYSALMDPWAVSITLLLVMEKTGAFCCSNSSCLYLFAHMVLVIVYEIVELSNRYD